MPPAPCKTHSVTSAASGGFSFGSEAEAASAASRTASILSAYQPASALLERASTSKTSARVAKPTSNSAVPMFPGSVVPGASHAHPKHFSRHMPFAGCSMTHRPRRICAVGGDRNKPRGLYHGVCIGPVNTEGACMSIVPRVSPWYDPSSAKTRTCGSASSPLFGSPPGRTNP